MQLKPAAVRVFYARKAVLYVKRASGCEYGTFSLMIFYGDRFHNKDGIVAGATGVELEEERFNQAVTEIKNNR